MCFTFQMRLIIDKVFRAIYSKIVKAIPKIKNEIGELKAPKSLNLPLSMFPCYRSIINKITENCFSLPRVRINICIKYHIIIKSKNSNLILLSFSCFLCVTVYRGEPLWLIPLKNNYVYQHNWRGERRINIC